MNDIEETNGLVVGVLSDTHGDLAADVLGALRGVDHIVHAGDIDKIDVVDRLKRVAPLTIVRGNMDYSGPTRALPKTACVEIGGRNLYVLHDLYSLDLDPGAADISVVIHGHTHSPEVTQKRGVLYLNPGSASLPKQGMRRSIAKLYIQNGTIEANIVEF